MATRMKAARKPAPRLAGGRKARRRKAKKRPLRADTVHSDMPLWGRPGFLLRRLHQIHYALFFEECAGFDITPVQYGLLTTVSLNPDLDQNSLARELGIDRTNVADVLNRSEEHTSELQSPCNLVCRLLLEKKKKNSKKAPHTSNKTNKQGYTK